MILRMIPPLFFQTAFFTPRHLLQRLPFYTCRRSEACRQRNRILPPAPVCRHTCFSVLIPVLVNWNIRESGISWARGTACSLTVSCHTRTVPIQTCGHFSGVTMQTVYQKYQERGGRPVFRPDNFADFQSLHRSLFDLAASDDYIRDMRINSGLNELLVLLMNESWHPAEHPDRARKKQNLLPVRNYLEAHYTEKIVLDELADRFFISKFHLSRVFKEQFGVSIHTYVRNLRITKAKQMLRFTDKKLEDIGYRCGLGAPHYFSRIFRQVEGITPSEFREKWGEAGR